MPQVDSSRAAQRLHDRRPVHSRDPALLVQLSDAPHARPGGPVRWPQPLHAAALLVDADQQRAERIGLQGPGQLGDLRRVDHVPGEQDHGAHAAPDEIELGGSGCGALDPHEHTAGRLAVEFVHLSTSGWGKIGAHSRTPGCRSKVGLLCQRARRRLRTGGSVCAQAFDYPAGLWPDKQAPAKILAERAPRGLPRETVAAGRDARPVPTRCAGGSIRPRCAEKGGGATAVAAAAVQRARRDAGRIPR